MQGLQKDWNALFNQYRLKWATEMNASTLDLFSDLVVKNALAQMSGEDAVYTITFDKITLKITECFYDGLYYSFYVVQCFKDDDKLFSFQVDYGVSTNFNSHNIDSLDLIGVFFLHEVEKIIKMVSNFSKREKERAVIQFQEHVEGKQIQQVVSDVNGKLFFKLCDDSIMPAGDSFDEYYENSKSS